MNKLVKEMDKKSVDICALQEIRWPGKGTDKKIIRLYIVDIKVTNMNLEQDFILVDIVR